MSEVIQENGVGLSAEFLEIAACPACHAKFAVDYDNNELVCTSSNCGLAFPVKSGVPVLLIDQGRKPGQSVKTEVKISESQPDQTGQEQPDADSDGEDAE